MSLSLPRLSFALVLASLIGVPTAACTVVSVQGEPATDASVDSDASSPNDAATLDSSVADASASSSCEVAVTTPPAALGLDPFYVKYLDADGVPIVGSNKVSEAAVRQACRITRKMLGFRKDVRDQMKVHRARISVMARTEVTTDIPEHSDLNQAFPGTDWNKRARGLGGTVARPATSCAEENLLCDASDPYVGENILVHELAHGMVNLGVVFADKTFQSRLDDAFAKAIAAGKWKDTYAASNVEEYFAEGVQSYFDTNIEAVPANGIHNEIDTRAELLAYDPALHALIAEVFGPDVWTPTCP